MRPDMDKVFCERPRYHCAPPKGIKKDFFKQMKNDGELAVKNQKISGLHKPYWGKESTHNYSAIEKYLMSQVGRKWNEIYSDICHVFNKNSYHKNKIENYLERMVTKEVYFKGNIPYILNSKLYCWTDEKEVRVWSKTYVHPDTGILCKTPLEKRVRYKRKVQAVLAGEKHCYWKDKNGIWWECWLTNLAKPTQYKYYFNNSKIFIYRKLRDKQFDMNLKRFVEDGAAALLSLYGNSNLYCNKRRQMGKNDIRKMKRDYLDKAN